MNQSENKSPEFLQVYAPVLVGLAAVGVSIWGVRIAADQAKEGWKIGDDQAKAGWNVAAAQQQKSTEMDMARKDFLALESLSRSSSDLLNAFYSPDKTAFERAKSKMTESLEGWRRAKAESEIVFDNPFSNEIHDLVQDADPDNIPNVPSDASYSKFARWAGQFYYKERDFIRDARKHFSLGSMNISKDEFVSHGTMSLIQTNLTRRDKGPQTVHGTGPGK